MIIVSFLDAVGRPLKRINKRGRVNSYWQIFVTSFPPKIPRDIDLGPVYDGLDVNTNV